MKAEQIDRIITELQNRGFGWICPDELRKLVLMTHSELVLDAVFTPLDDIYPGPVALDWIWHEDLQSFIARVPAKDYLGDGHLKIYAIKRPGYCDRGKWHVLVEAVGGCAGLDCQEGFPRYFFRLENLREEMELWANERESVKEALKARGNI